MPLPPAEQFALVSYDSGDFDFVLRNGCIDGLYAIERHSDVLATGDIENIVAFFPKASDAITYCDWLNGISRTANVKPAEAEPPAGGK